MLSTVRFNGVNCSLKQEIPHTIQVLELNRDGEDDLKTAESLPILNKALSDHTSIGTLTLNYNPTEKQVHLNDELITDPDTLTTLMALVWKIARAHTFGINNVKKSLLKALKLTYQTQVLKPLAQKRTQDAASLRKAFNEAGDEAGKNAASQQLEASENAYHTAEWRLLEPTQHLLELMTPHTQRLDISPDEMPLILAALQRTQETYYLCSNGTTFFMYRNSPTSERRPNLPPATIILRPDGKGNLTVDRSEKQAITINGAPLPSYHQVTLHPYDCLTMQGLSVRIPALN